MSGQNAAYMAEYYRDSFQKYGDDPKSLHWWSDRRNIRYYELLKYADWQEGLLDIGCGFGDVNQFIAQTCQGNGGGYRYLGVDLLPEFVEAGRKKYGTKCIEFLQGDVGKSEIYDKIKAWTPAWGIASGIFNIPNEGRHECYDFMLSTMEHCFELCHRGISFNFVSDRVDFQKPGMAYHSPMRVLEWAYAHTRNVILDNSCMPFECTITMFKNDAFDDAMCFERFRDEHRAEFESGLFKTVKRE